MCQHTYTLEITVGDYVRLGSTMRAKRPDGTLNGLSKVISKVLDSGKLASVMKVTFTKTAERRYRVSVEGPGVVSSWMEPAPGFDERLPHDMAHFVVENELGIKGGVFGQLAVGGHSNTFHPTDDRVRRKLAKRGHRIAVTNRDDALLSERLVSLACQMWTTHRSESKSPVQGVSVEDLARVCRTFDAVSAIWSKLAVGDAMTLDWTAGAGRTGRRRLR